MARVRGHTKEQKQNALLAEMDKLGGWDCGHAFDGDDWPIRDHDTAEEVFEAGKDALLGYEPDWYEQNEDAVASAKKLDLEREKLFEGWVAGWKACALPKITKLIDADRASRKA